MRSCTAREALEWLGESPKRQIGKELASKEELGGRRHSFVQKILDVGALQVNVVGAFELFDGLGYADCLYIVLPDNMSERTNLLVYLANLRSADPDYTDDLHVLVEHVVDSPSVVAVTFV